MNTKLQIIIVILIAFTLIPLTISISGTNDENNINITKGQINIAPINTETSLTLLGATQYIVGIGKDILSKKTRFGILEINKIPSTPELLNPNNNSYLNNETVKFSWEADEPDNDTLTSLIEIFNNTVLTKIYHRNYTIETNPNNTIEATYYNVTISEETTFYWRVLVNDSEFNSTFSELRTFTIDTTVPTSFNLTSPANATSSTDTTPELAWTPTTETNIDNYTIEFCSTAACSNPVIKGSTTATSFSTWEASKALTQGFYVWSVKAIDKANNQNTSSLFIYIVEVSETITVTTTTGGGGGELQGGTGSQLYSLSIISPPDITIYANDTLQIPLVISNPATLITLKSIYLNVTSDSDDVDPFLAETYIPFLRPKEQRTVPLRITTHTAPGTYGLTITASVTQPQFIDKVRILANLIELDSADKARVSKQLGFAKDLINGNPECLDLREYITESERSLEEGKYDQAISLAQNAIQSCQKLISIRKTPIARPLLEIPYIIKENKTLLILASEILALMLFLLIIFKLLKKKKKKKKITPY